MDNIIWVFREPRSGGTWFTEQICLLLNKENYFLDSTMESKSYDEREIIILNRKQEPEDINRVLNTHHFFALKSIYNYHNPIIIKVTRKNKVEQFLSECTIKYTHMFNITKKQQLLTLPKLEKTIVPVKDVLDFVKRSQQQQEIWDYYSTKFLSEVIYYEDLLEGYDSSVLSLNNLCMKNSDITYKIPYDKRNLYLNYDKVKSIIEANLD